MEKFNKYIERIERIDNLIKRRNTGTPSELAQKLSLCERRLYTYIKYMKEEFNAPIRYDKTLRTYTYTDKEFCLHWHKAEKT